MVYLSDGIHVLDKFFKTREALCRVSCGGSCWVPNHEFMFGRLNYFVRVELYLLHRLKAIVLQHEKDRPSSQVPRKRSPVQLNVLDRSRRYRKVEKVGDCGLLRACLGM
jgi:hypothetical protein